MSAVSKKVSMAEDSKMPRILEAADWEFEG